MSRAFRAEPIRSECVLVPVPLHVLTNSRLMNKPASLDRLAELRRLAFASRHVRGGLLAEVRPRIPVGGTELTSYRDYAPGDDHRHIDWNVCARHDELRVRLFAGRLDRHVRILLDCSASMGLGTPLPRFEAARQIAAAIGYLAIDREARLSLFAFSDHLCHRIGPLRGRARIARLLNAIDVLPSPSGTTDMRRAAETLVRMDPTNGPVIVVSDFCEPQSLESGLNVLRSCDFSPRVVHLVDPAEDESLSAGDLELVDTEGDAAWQLTLTPAQLRRYRELAAQDRERPRLFCRKHHIPYVRTGVSVPDGSMLADIITLRECAT